MMGGLSVNGCYYPRVDGQTDSYVQHGNTTNELNLLQVNLLQLSLHAPPEPKSSARPTFFLHARVCYMCTRLEMDVKCTQMYSDVQWTRMYMGHSRGTRLKQQYGSSATCVAITRTPSPLSLSYFTGDVQSRMETGARCTSGLDVTLELSRVESG
jgi:hypothetical protein